MKSIIDFEMNNRSKFLSVLEIITDNGIRRD